MTQVAKTLLFTCALLYANGSIHLVHIMEYIHDDVWFRYQRITVHEDKFLCAADASGTPTHR
ncbi:hypothetical protein A6V36_38090 [Paraburkholderia ginsengiterrae]|uniref:Methionyl/Leucyl tRNA synthetase domain-containing protein n=2 Tax=Paraburkholderia ginsengiterrae TaxID=1462993 RepID=A0ABX2UW82_9BURK|nr:hypothetical protein A6V36_38090 [Paraburkholderia ginsengiterrae]